MFAGVAALLIVVPFRVADRLEDAFDPHWWTALVRVGPASVAFQWFLAWVTRPEDAVRWSLLRGWIREEPPKQES